MHKPQDTVTVKWSATYFSEMCEQKWDFLHSRKFTPKTKAAWMDSVLNKKENLDTNNYNLGAQCKN